jgi:hypothetical protein
MTYQRARTLSLRSHSEYSEKWLQERIAEDPSLLGLGELVVRDIERRQPRAGRLDLLLSDPETGTRYEVELQLGATDEAHIIRTVEYWDIERSRYPQFDHVAVIVAEDITSRFLNVISLFNKAIPLIAIQMNALQIGSAVTLHATTVLNLMSIGAQEDEDEPGQSTDRAFWEERGSTTTVRLAEDFLAVLNTFAPGHELKFNKHYVGLSRSGLANNFMTFRPRRSHLIVEFRIPQSEELTARLDAGGLDLLSYEKRFGYYRVRVSGSELAEHSGLLKELVATSAGVAYTPEEAAALN